MKRRFIIFLTIIFCLAASSTIVFGNDRELTNDNLTSLNDKENLSVTKYNELLKSWSTDSMYYSDSDANYPDSYGGAYINDEKELVIQVTCLDENIKEYYGDIIDLSGVRFEEVGHSLFELRNIKADLLEDIEIGEGTGIAGVGIDMQDNSVAIYTVVNSKDISVKDLAGITRKVARTTDKVKYIPVCGYDNTCAAVYPGTAINTASTSRSIGFWAKNSSGDLGIVTAPHSSISYGTTMKIGGTNFGTAQTPKFSGNTDAVFIKRTNTTFSPSRYISGWDCNIKSRSYIVLPVGASSRSKGITSGCRRGIVKDTNYTTSYGIKDTVLTTAVSKAGDSGGVVINDSELDCLVGIITGSQGSTNYQIYVKAKNILDNLNVTVY